MPYDIRDNSPSTSFLSISLYIDFTSFATGDMKSSHSFSKNLTILWCGKKATKKSSKLCGDSCLITSYPLTTNCRSISVSRIALRKYPFATVGQLLVCPPSTAPFAARTAFGVCPFPRPCPARHLVPVTLGETRLYLWLFLIVWHFSWFVKKFFSSFSTNPVILLGLFAQNTLQIPKKGQTNAPGYATLRQTT